MRLALLPLALALVMPACGNPVLQQRGSAECTQASPAPCPTQPILDIRAAPGGGVCLDESDAKELLLYIKKLEQHCGEREE